MRLFLFFAPYQNLLQAWTSQTFSTFKEFRHILIQF